MRFTEALKMRLFLLLLLFLVNSGHCRFLGVGRECACTREFRPVCGDDGRDYNNACNARCVTVGAGINPFRKTEKNEVLLTCTFIQAM